MLGCIERAAQCLQAHHPLAPLHTAEHPCTEVRELRSQHLVAQPYRSGLFSDDVDGRQEQEIKVPLEPLFPLPHERQNRERQGAGQQASGDKTRVPGRATAIPASPHAEPEPQQLSLLPDVTAPSAQSRTRPRSPVAPRAPHRQPLSDGTEHPVRDSLIPKLAGTALIHSPHPEPVERGGGGFEGKDPAKQKPLIKFLALYPGGGGLLTTEGENPFSVEGKERFASSSLVNGASRQKENRAMVCVCVV